MENNMTLFQLADEERMIASILEDNGGEITPELEALWQDNKESMAAKAGGYATVIRRFKAMAEAAKAEAKRCQAIAKTAENSEKRVKEHILAVMENFDIRSIEGKDGTRFTRSESVSTEVDEETLLAPYRGVFDLVRSKLPAWITFEVKVNKTVLKDSFKDKDVMPAGVTFSRISSLRIR